MELNPATIKAITKDSIVSQHLLQQLGQAIQNASHHPVSIGFGLVDDNAFENILYSLTLQPSGILNVLIDVASYAAVTKGLAKRSAPLSAFDVYATFLTHIDFTALSPNTTIYTPLPPRFKRWRQEFLRQHQWRIVSPPPH